MVIPSPACGGGLGWGLMPWCHVPPCIQCLNDPLQHAVAVFQNFVVPETENTPTTPFEKGIASIMIAGRSMVAAICFDDEPRFRTGKIGDIRPDHELPAKTPAQLTLAEDPPKRPFGIRSVSP
jgi:hypothetical protein